MKIPVKLHSIIIFCCLIGLAGRAGAAGDNAVTPHDLLPEQKIEVTGEELPQWKTVWDRARNNALQGNFEESLQHYRTLLILKGNLEEARWEMARLLMHLKRWEEAAEQLEILLGSDPENSLYISSLGKVMWEMKQYERAVTLFKKIYAKSPTDQLVLAGLVEGLMKLGRKLEALPFLEQLSRQEPTNRGVRGYLASVYFDEGDYEKARPHFTILARSEEVEPEILYKTARTYEQLNLVYQASIYWERYSARVPDSREARLFLAQYYEENGQPARSLQHLEGLLAHNPDDVSLLIRLGRAYEKTGDVDHALRLYEKSLTLVPEDQKMLQSVADLTAKERAKKQAPPAAALFSSDDSGPGYVDLKKSLLQMEPGARYREGRELYRKLIAIVPADHEVVEALTGDLLVLADDRGLSEMMGYLADVAADHPVTYRAIAGVLQKLNREEPLLAVLVKIHQTEPEDPVTLLELAKMHLRKDELLKSRDYFVRLADDACLEADCLQARALLWEKLRQPEHQLRDYEILLKKQPERYKIRLRALHLAANLGLIDTAVYHAGYLQHMPSVRENIQWRILLADAYRESGYFRRARQRYTRIIQTLRTENSGDAVKLRIRCWLGMAESYTGLNLYYEAEQTLRVALAQEGGSVPLLEALFSLALDRGEIAEAEVWLQALIREIDGLAPVLTPQAGLTWKKFLLQARLLSARGEYLQAAAMSRKAQSVLPVPLSITDGFGGLFEEDSPGLTIGSQTALNLMYGGEYAAAAQVIRGLGEHYRLEMEPLVLLEQLYRATGEIAGAEKTAASLNAFAAEDYGRQLILAELYRKYGNPGRYLEAAETAVTANQHSLAAQRRYVEAQIAGERYQTALESLDRLQAGYPDNTWLMSRRSELLARVGEFEQSLVAGGVILADNPGRQDVILRNARILWEMNRWKDSIRLYEGVLEPPVEDLLTAELESRSLAIPVNPPGSWWKKVTSSMDMPIQIPEIIMSPLHAVDFSDNGQAFNSAAARHYALYRWQQRLGRELEVRQAVMHWEYFHAANMLEDVIDDYGDDDFLIFDLAGLYSKLDRLGDEAVLYENLRVRNEYFPGLAEAAQRNNLKRRPQVYLSYTVREDDGWYGYRALKQEIMNTGGWYFTSVNQKWSVDVSRIDYESTGGSRESIEAWRGMLTYDAKLSQFLSLSLGAGFQDLGGGYDDMPLLSGKITGKIADEVRAYVSARQDVTDDTLASLTRNIRRRDYRGGIMLDIIPRIVFGGSHDFIDYSDSNWTRKSSFWASYIFLPDPNLLKFSYSYDYLDSEEGQMPGVPGPDGFAPNDHPYWSPNDYWMTKFSLYFKQQFSNDALARGVPSYYTIEYSLGYDSFDNDLHEFKGSLNIELAKHYILGASYGYVDLDVYQNHEVAFTVMYRW